MNLCTIFAKIPGNLSRLFLAPHILFKPKLTTPIWYQGSSTELLITSGPPESPWQVLSPENMKLHSVKEEFLVQTLLEEIVHIDPFSI